MSDEEKCSWCGAEVGMVGKHYAEFACGSWRGDDRNLWYRGDKCVSPPPPIPPAPPPIPRPQQPASDRQELIRRFAVAIATTGKCFPWPVIWRMATELADAEPQS